MTLFTIAKDNLLRQKGKTAFLIAGILIGITATTALLSTSQAMRNDFQEKMDRYGANLVISPMKEELSLTYGSVSLPGLKIQKNPSIKKSELSKLTGLKVTKVISPKIIGSTKIEGKENILVGLNFKEEIALKNWWEVKGRLPKTDYELLTGSIAAKRLNAGVGKRINVNGKEFQISGVISQSGSSDDNVIFGSIGSIGRLLGKEGRFNLVEASVAKGNEPGKVAKEINAKFQTLEATAVSESLTAQASSIRMFTWFSIITSLIILFISSLVIFITTVSNVNERTREIGIFRAVGFRKKHVFSIFLIESIMVSLIGGVTGVAVGTIGSAIMMPFVAKSVSSSGFNPVLSLLVFILALFVGIVSSLIPAKKAAAKDPAEALRFI